MTVAGVIVANALGAGAHRAGAGESTQAVVRVPLGLRAWSSAAERPVERYRVVVEHGLSKARPRFVRVVDGALTDPRGWGHDYTFRRVTSRQVAFTVVLATPDRTDQLCAPMQTNGIYSCYNNGRSVINRYRWRHGAKSYGWQRRLWLYRRYVVLHEVGHALGYGHRYRCRADGLAPTMMQQTKSLYGCKRNAWPYPRADSSSAAS